MPDIWFNLFNDELLFSGIGRSQCYNSLAMTKTQEIFFGRKYQLAQFNIPSNLNFFCEQFGYSIYEILNNHTIYKYVSIFASIEKQIRFLDYVTKEDNNMKQNGMSAFMGMYAENVYKIPKLYCPICMKEDIDLVGVPFFHVSHNLPGVRACHKHGIFLLEYKSSYNNQYQIFDINNSEDILLPVNKHDIKLSKLAYEILNIDIGSLSRETIVSKIRTGLNRMGLIKRNNVVNQTELTKKMKEFYGEYLDEIKYPLSDKVHSNWLRRIPRTKFSKDYIPPIQFLLVINMITSSMTQFLEHDVDLAIDKLDRKQSQPDEKVYKFHIDCLLAAVKDHPEWKRKDFIINLCKSYRYVCRYDKAFIDRTLPPIQQKKALNKDYDYQTDFECLAKLKEAHLFLLNERPFVRITKHSLGKAIGRFSFNNYVLCLQYIKSMSETNENFRLRVGKVIIDDYFEKGSIPSLNTIRKSNRMFKSSKHFNPVVKELTNYIDEKLKNDRD